MKLLFKQRFFSWFDSYDIYNEAGEIMFQVKGQFSWGKKLEICDASGAHIGTLEQKIFSFLPAYELYLQGRYVGTIKKVFSFFSPSFEIDCNGWSIDGDWMEWDYEIVDSSNMIVASISKEIFKKDYCW